MWFLGIAVGSVWIWVFISYFCCVGVKKYNSKMEILNWTSVNKWLFTFVLFVPISQSRIFFSVTNNMVLQLLTKTNRSQIVMLSKYLYHILSLLQFHSFRICILCLFTYTYTMVYLWRSEVNIQKLVLFLLCWSRVSLAVLAMRCVLQSS